MSAVLAWANVVPVGVASTEAAATRSETGSGRSSSTAFEAAASTFPPRITKTPALASRLMYWRLFARCRAYSAWVINLSDIFGPICLKRREIQLFDSA